ncbi:MAG: DUF4845 domain-containing protein [Gammaproteobacteria bacterium]|jgi:hypothetical protein
MKPIGKQHGLTMPTIAALFALLAFFVLIALTLFPIYMENFNVSSHVKRLGHDARMGELSKHELESTLLKRFGIDDVKNVHAEDIIISDTDGGYLIEVDYEVRKHFIGNIDIVASFHEEQEVKK